MHKRRHMLSLMCVTAVTTALTISCFDDTTAPVHSGPGAQAPIPEPSFEVVGASQPLPGDLYLNDAGGNCPDFGEWDGASWTCTLTQDVYPGRVFIAANGIALDGGGHKTGQVLDELASPGGVSDVTVANLIVEFPSWCGSGIYFALPSSNLRLTNNTLICGGYEYETGSAAIYVASGDNVSITENVIGSGWGRGVYLNGTGSTVEHNQLSVGRYGWVDDEFFGFTATPDPVPPGQSFQISAWPCFRVWPGFNMDMEIHGSNHAVRNNAISSGTPLGPLWVSANDSEIYGNTFVTFAGGEAVYLNGTGNAFYNNNFLGLYPPPDGPFETAVVYHPPLGPNNALDGNYYGVFDSPEEGCTDLDGDIRCDAPYIFGDWVDNRPWASPNGWDMNNPLTVPGFGLEAEWDWGDGTPTTTGPVYTYAPASHAYSQPGVYTITLTLTGYGRSKDHDYQYAVVYDPSVGSASGGGKVDGGQANFGFVAKNRREVDVPSGHTQFQFRNGDIHFSSTSYDWLAVTGQGTRAQFKGIGSVNGLDGYGFMVWASDGEPDRFRIKIWEEDDSGNEVVVYDNADDRLHAPDADVVTHGNVVIRG